MDAQSSAVSILGSLDSLLVLLGDSVQDRLFRIEKSQPGSIRRSLLRTQGRLTSKLEHRDNAHLKVMMVGPVADSLARRIGEIADPESGVLSVVDFRLNRVSESLRASALGARGRVASQLNRAQTLIATRTNLHSTHAGLMGRLSGDVMIDQQVRREITDVENQLAGLQREEVRLLEELRSEADALRQKIDAVVQMLSGYIRLGLTERVPQIFPQMYQQDSDWGPDSEPFAEGLSEAGFLEKMPDWLPGLSERTAEVLTHAYLRYVEQATGGFRAGQYPSNTLRVARFLLWNVGWKFWKRDDELLRAFKGANRGNSGTFWLRARDAAKRLDHNFANFQTENIWKGFSNNISGRTFLVDAVEESLKRGSRGVLEGLQEGNKVITKVWVKGAPTANVLRVAGVAGAVSGGIKEYSDEYTRQLNRGSSNAHVHAAADSAIVAAAGYTGAIYGAAVGQVLIPIPIVGAAVGGFVGGYLAPKVAKWATDTRAFEWAVDRWSKSPQGKAVLVVASSTVKVADAVLDSGKEILTDSFTGVKKWLWGD